MNLRLAYRIASIDPYVPTPSLVRAGLSREDIHTLLKDASMESSLIPKLPQFSLDNVATFVAEHDRREWHPTDDVPNWTPPFQSFFVEWNSPTFQRVGGDLVRVTTPDYQSGFLVTSDEVTDECKGTAGYWESLAEKHGLHGLLDADISGVADGKRLCRWMIRCSRWVTCADRPLCGSPLWTSHSAVIFVSPTGKHLTHATFGFFDNEQESHSFNSDLLTLGLGISFCHCKNVRKVENEADAGNAWHKRNKTPRIKFYTLDINPMREVLRHEGQSESVGMKRAMHICRGHFATYSEDSPLFGKYVGTFWRPDHTRGSKEAGEVHKRYQVDAKK